MNTDGDKRIVIVSSSAAKVFGVWDPNNLQGDTNYARAKFYGNSKLYNVSDLVLSSREIPLIYCIICYRKLYPCLL